MYPWLKSALFPVEYESIMYCSVPKVASKTLISLVTYVYIRHIIHRLNQNQTKELIDATLFIQQLRILNPVENKTIPLRSLLDSFQHLLRYERMNISSPSIYFNPWQLSLTRVFPGIEFQRLTNLSKIFDSSSTRIIFVRHPFERFASAYKERIALLPQDRIEPQPFYDSFRKDICYQYLPPFPNESFWSRSNRCEKYIPSFRQFTEYILMQGETSIGLAAMDPHWKPYTLLCQTCKFRYNFIGKYETFENDFNILLRQLNISDWDIHKRRGASGFTKTDYKLLYNNLPNHLKDRLQKLYREDLELFQYRVDDYLKR